MIFQNNQEIMIKSRKGHQWDIDFIIYSKQFLLEIFDKSKTGRLGHTYI